MAGSADADNSQQAAETGETGDAGAIGPDSCPEEDELLPLLHVDELPICPWNPHPMIAPASEEHHSDHDFVEENRGDDGGMEDMPMPGIEEGCDRPEGQPAEANAGAAADTAADDESSDDSGSSDDPDARWSPFDPTDFGWDDWLVPLGTFRRPPNQQDTEILPQVPDESAPPPRAPAFRRSLHSVIEDTDAGEENVDLEDLLE